MGDRIYSVEKTIAEMSTNGVGKYTRIRWHAKKITSTREQKCNHCGYDKHVETCHIKSIGDFPKTTKMSVVNDPSNLILLCPNCHWKMDHPKCVPRDFHPAPIA